MATRHQALPPKKEKATLKQPNYDAKNRRALEHIDNIVYNRRVVEGKPRPQANRRVTRSFGAQLIANAQKAAAVDAANKTKIEGTIKGLSRIELEPKPKDKSVILISPVIAKGSSRVTTLTSVLTARSKVAGGILDKPKSSVRDIDAADTKDEFAVVEYIEDLFNYYKQYEQTYMPPDYIGSQPEINESMRATLIDWLIAVHHKFELMPETLYLTISVIDRYLSSQSVLKKELQLVGMSAMLIACKYEEIWAPEVNDFICISDKAYTREQILKMEKEILNRLEWNLTVPTMYVFLERFAKAALCDKEMENMVFFFAELALMQYSVAFMYCPSMVAASAVLAARCTLEKSPLWTSTLKHYTSFSELQLLHCTQRLVGSHLTAPTGRLQVVYKRYSSSELGAVALKPPATKKMSELRRMQQQD